MSGGQRSSCCPLFPRELVHEASMWDTLILRVSCPMNLYGPLHSKGLFFLSLKWLPSHSGPPDANFLFLPVFHCKQINLCCSKMCCCLCDLSVFQQALCSPAYSFSYPGLESSVTPLDRSSLIIQSVRTLQISHFFPLDLPCEVTCSCLLPVATTNHSQMSVFSFLEFHSSFLRSSGPLSFIHHTRWQIPNTAHF